MEFRDLLLSAGAGALGLAAAPGESKTIRAAILGTRHSHTLGKLDAMKASPDFEVIAVCEPDAAAREQAQKNPIFEGLRWTTEDELLADASIRLIVVECNVWEALPQGKKVIIAGKHLHLEKPPGNDWRAFRELAEEARRRKLLLQTGYVWRSHEGITAAIEAARKGWLGEVFMVRGTMNSDRDAQQRAVEAKYRGGSLFELGGHVIDRTVELLGRPKNVKSWLRHDTSYPDQLADNTLVVFEYEKALAVISSSARMYGSADHRSFEVIGSDGSIIVNPEAARPRLRVAMRKPQGPYRAGWQEILLPPQPRFVGDFQELARALKTGTALRLSYDHELLLQETLLRASGELS
jgi:predicted dehydrogenase